MRDTTHNSRVEKLKKALFKATKTVSWAFYSVLNFIVSTVTVRSSKLATFLTLVLFAGGLLATFYFVLADDADVYNVQVINVFPGKISAPGWDNAETLVQQNVNELALYQDFNFINSATFDIEKISIDQIIKNRKEIKTSESMFASNTPAVTPDVVSPDVETNINEIVEPTGDESVNAEEVIIPESVDEPIDANTSTTTAYKKPKGALGWVFSSVTKWLPFVNESTTTPIVSEDSVVAETPVESDIVEVPDSIVSSSTDDVEELIEETIDLNTSENAINEDVVEMATTTINDDLYEENVFLEQESDNSTDIDTSPEPITATCGEDCAEYSITLSDFGLPIFDGEFSLHGAQLKVSFAAKLKKNREVVQHFKLKYSFDEGATWSEAGDVLIDEEVSNSTNGGYFLFALPEIGDSETLNNLMVQLAYDDDPRALEGLFVESAWLELFTLEAPSVVDDNLALLNDDGYDPSKLTGDQLTLPDGTEVHFDFTDENKNETLIIKSDKVSYPGLSETTLYFNVTNTSKSADTFKLQTYFPGGIGEVNSIALWNQNKPKDVIVPEYKPFVYHCEAGWELTTNPINGDLEDISKLLSPISDETAVSTTTEEETLDAETQNIDAAADATEEEGSEQDDGVDEIEIDNVSEDDTETESTDDPLISTDGADENTNSDNESLKPVVAESPLLQSTIQNAIASTSDDGESDDELATTYVCRNTNIVRACDEIDGDNTACRVNDVKVREHKLVHYTDDWEEENISEGKAADTRGFFKKAKDFLGFGPDIKPVPESFEVRAHTPNEYTIAAGETKYFKMEISFPPLTTGEFWIEAIGDDEYGLLDPYWASQWNYRMPITIDNTSGTSNLTEQQVFLELNSSLTNFWTNVNNDGSDIRFVQETTVGTEDAWYGTGWAKRIPVTIQSSQVPSSQTNFPVYLNLADLGPAFFSAVQSDGDDIRITTSDGTTEVPIDLVSINTGAHTGELHFKGDISSSANTTFYVYFANSDAVGYADNATYGAENVWTNNFLATYHLEENAAGAGNAGLYIDSTSNGEDANDEITSTGKTGKVGLGQEIRSRETDPDDYILIPNTVLNGETNITHSFWLNTSQTGDQALISGGANNEYLIFLQNTVLTLYAGGSTASFTLDTTVTNGNWHHIVMVRDDTSNQARLYVDGVADNQNPVAISMGALSIPSNCLMIGGEQDGCLVAWGQPQELDGFVDEQRFRSGVSSADWITATYRNQATTTNFYATSTIQNFTSTTFSELDYWLQYFSTTTDQADIWVQVDSLPAGASTTIYMYYGNSNATPASDEFAPFTYSTTTPIYYVVEGLTTGPIDVYSYIDNNRVAIDGGSPISLDAGETTSFVTYSSSSVISSLGPIAATVDDAGGDTIAPISFATTTFAVPTTRNTSSYYIHSPFASSTVRTYLGNSGTANQTLSVATGTTRISTTDGSGANGVVIDSTNPVLVFHMETGSRDSFVAYPPTTRDIFGIYTGSAYISTLIDNPNPTVYCSGGGSTVVSGVTRGEQQSIGTCTSTNQGAGNSARLTGQATAISAIQQADGDGNESSAFWARHEMGTRYYIPTDSAYVAIACAPRFGTTTLEVRQNDGTFVQGATCTPGTNTPGKVYFDNGQGGSNLAFSAGYQVVSTNGVPFYAIYEDDEEDNDETNMLGSVQGRKYANRLFSYSFGAQEITIDAEYEQLSFGWYENANNQTPTSTWPLGEGSFATEGVAITGQGAVNTGDVLRLRMNVQANVATGSASSTAFKLQYTEATSGQCSLATSWYDVGAIGSSTAAFNGYNNSSVVDGTTLTTNVLASSTVAGTYEEENLSEFIPNPINPNQVAEWDWVLTNNNATVNSNYCFRMVRSTGVELVTYSSYPELETAGPPLAPSLITFFDNERTSTSSPVVLDFAATDLAGDDIRYQIQVDDDVLFGSPIIDRNSQTHLTQFENVNTPSDKTPFDSGARIRFTGSGSLTASTTYWWRARGLDEDGSNTWGEWSTPYSFTTDGSVTVSEWHQTTGDQFNTNSLSSLATSSGAVSVSGSSGTMFSTPIDFDDATVGNAWGEFSWVDTETSGTILYQIQYLNGTTWTLIPDSAIANNSTGNGTSPINLLDLDTDTYNEIRLVANFTGTNLSIQDWTVIWGQRVETPTLGDPFDNEKISTTTPTFDFTTTDPQGDSLQYEISWSTDYTFTSSSTRNSSSASGFSAGNPFTSGATVTYTIQGGEALTNGTTYWWRVRAKDPSGGNAWSPWSDPDSFTVDTSVTVSTWFQTTRDQFRQGTLSGLVASTSGSVTISNEVGEYGKTVLNAGTWTKINTQVSYNNPVVVASVRYSPTGDAQLSARVRNKTADSFELIVDDPFGTLSGTTTVDYLVMEAGVWTLQDGASGKQVIAGTFDDVSDVQGGGSYAASGYGADVTFTPAFASPPAVIATVSSENDSSWVIAHLNDGNTRNNPPTASAMGLYLGRSNESAVHSPEDIDYVAFATGHGTNNGAEFDADFGNDAHDEAPVTAEAFTSAFSPSAPQVVITMQGAEQGGNGAWMSIDSATPPTTANYYPLSDESGDRNHTPEPALTLAFENSSGILLRNSSVGGDLTGTIYSEPILFSDGTGPKFERLLWNDTETGTSTIKYQIQYLTSTSSWALIPNVDLPGNTTGTTTSPIDLTGLNVVNYHTIRIVGNFACASGNCPSLHDWTVEWSEGVLMTGTAKEYNRSTNVTTGTVRAAVNGSILSNTGTIAGGTWSISNVTAFAGDVVTVWVDGAAEADEAVAVFVYDGIGDITGVELFEQHLSLSSDENATTTNALLSAYDNSVSGDEDIFFDVNGLNDLSVCSLTGCSEASLYIGVGDVYIPDTTSSGNVSTHDFINSGHVELDGNTVRVSGSWKNNSILLPETSTVIFTATSTNETVDDADSLLDFQNLTFGETSGTATWQTLDPLDINGALNVTYGTLNRASSTITIAGNLTTGTNGFWSGVSTTTFDGSGVSFWSDANTTKQNAGRVVVDGSSKTVTMSSSVYASSTTIGSNDTLSAGGANTLFLAGSFTNNNVFSAQTGTIQIIGTSTNAIIKTNGSTLYNLTASTTGNGTISFTEPSVSMLGNLTIATGTVTMTTATTSIGGSFLNTGGTFVHNNGAIRFTGSGSQSVRLGGTTFLNHLYNVAFSGAGTYTFIDANATTSNNFRVSNGTVVLPSGSLVVGGIYSITGTGAFSHNNGEVIFLVEDNETVAANGSSFNNVRVRDSFAMEGYNYNASWNYRQRVTIKASQIDADLTNFPVYINLADFNTHFFNNINSNGGDIRVTTADGMTEVPREIVSASTTAKTGEMYFLAPNLSSTTDTIFYVYYGNSGASDYAINATYGAENVWDSNYLGVYHLKQTSTGAAGEFLDSTAYDNDGTGEGTVPTPTVGRIGTGQDFAANGRIDLGVAANWSSMISNNEYMMSVWLNLDTSATDQAIVSNWGGGADGILWWADTSPGQNGFCHYINGTYTPSDCQTLNDQDLNNWQYLVARYDGSNGYHYVNGVSAGTGATAASYTTATANMSIGTADGNSNTRPLDGQIDEVRISAVDRGQDWITAEYRNQSTTTDFYTIGTGAAEARTFVDTDATALGNVVIETNAVAILPSGNLYVGGSFDSDGTMDANGGTIRFNSTAGTETISFGTSTPHNVLFNSATGNWTIIDNATTTGNVTLTNTGSLTLNSSLSLYVGGQFTSAVGGASTTWTGSNIILGAGTDYAINTKTAPSDIYATITITGDGDVSLWNSSAGTYTMQGTASLYSQDHAGVDGDLYIFGNYVRTIGTEYWSYDTDFDGTNLTASSSGRQVDVRIQNGATVVASTSAIQIVGTTSASTTVDAQSGSYTLIANTATVTASYFEIANTNASGLQLLGSSTVSSFNNAYFRIPAASTAVTVDASTINTNPAKQFYDTDFVTAGGSTNVTLSGTTTGYWWFRDGAGDRYGEAFDNDGANPGAIRWDDSTYSVSVSGTVFSDEGTTLMGAPVCDDVTPVVKVVVNGSSSFSGPCSSASSTYNITGVTFAGDPNVIVYLDTNNATSQPAAVTLRSETTGSGTTNGATGAITINRPGTIANGDVLVIILGKDDSPAITAPAGWTTGDTLGSASGNLVHTGIWYKRITNAATEPASYTFTGDVSEAVSYWSGALVNVDPVTPQDVSFSNRWVNSTNDVTPNALSVTTVTAGSYVLAASYIDTDNSVTAPGAPWATRAVNVFVAGDNNNLVVSSRSMSSPGATGDTTVSGVAGGSESNNGQFAFRRLTYASSTVHGAVVTRTASTNLTNLHIYANRVITRHEDTAPLAISNMSSYTSANDSDVPFSVTLGSPNTLTLQSNTELHIATSTTFAPGGNVTVRANATGNTYDGSLHIGPSATFRSVGTETHTFGGSFTVGSGGTFVAASSTVVMNATTTGKTITAASTIPFNQLQFTGVGGGWNLNTNITAASNISVATGTVTGTSDITVSNGSFSGNGLVSLGGGTLTMNHSNTLGGTQGWTFNNLTLGNGSTVGTTTPGGTATNTVSSVLTINTAHFLDGNNSAWNLTGTGNVFVENGTFLEDTTTVRYGGVLGSNVRNTAYYNLFIEASGGTPTYTANATGMQVLNNLRVGGVAATTFNLNTNDPIGTVNGDVSIESNGSLIGSNTATLTVGGSWDNNGTFTSSGGTVIFNSTDAFSIAAGVSSFGAVTVSGVGPATVTEHATSTGAWTLATSSNFTVSSGQRLAIGGLFTNGAGGAATTWTGSTLHLFGTGQFEINASTTQDVYETLSAAAGTHIRMWNSSSTNYTTVATSSIYSMNHANVAGGLYIFGNYVRSSGTDYWSYSTNFDGTPLGSGRKVDVYVRNGGSFAYSGGSLQMIGTSTASTTVQVQGGSGTYSADVTAGGINAQYYVLRNMDNDGLTLTGSPAVTTLSNGEFIIGNTGATAMTVAGSVITANPAKNFISNRFATSTGVSSAFNVTTTGSTVSSWRFTNHTGDVDGESFDADNGDPGYIVWDDSLAVITISGNVYENDTTTVSSVCNGVTPNIVLAVAGVVVPAASSSCSIATGAYSISGVSFSPNDTLTLFINSNAAGNDGATISIDPISSVGDMDIYEDHVIVRHESTDPISIADMSVYDSSDDPDILFTAIDAGTDTLTLNTNTKLLVWTNKEFRPQGNITTGGGAGTALDGTVGLRNNAILTLANGQTHTIGGNLEMGTNSVFVPAQSTITFTSSGTGRTIDTNEAGFYNVIFNGTGTFISSDTALSIANDATLTNGALTLPVATTTITGSLAVTGGSFVANGGLVRFNSAAAETIVAANSNFNRLLFSGTGSWSMNDVNATATGAVTIQSGSVTLPSGVFTVGGSFRNTGGTISHNTSLLVISTSTTASLRASSSDLFGVTFTGGGTFTMEDNSLTLRDDLILNSGTLTLASGTLAVGGSFNAAGGTFAHASGTVLFNANTTGKIINPGSNNFYNVSIASPTGGWTMQTNATTTGNFSLTSANSYTQTSGTALSVLGVFSNSVGGTATTWTNSTLKLLSGTDYSINTKSAGGDVYGTLYIANNMDTRMWNSSAATTTLASTSISSLYSQDHANTDGYLYIYGNYQIATGTQYWSYANDFDGTALGGGSRAVNVFLVDAASTSVTMTNGSLNIIGAAGATTSIESLGTTQYSFDVTGGTLNAQYYKFRELDINGLTFVGIPIVSSLSDGDFEVIASGGTAITLASTTLNANPSKLIDNVRFATTTAISATNVKLDATTTNAWTFRDHIGNLSGEAHDIDGTDNCGSIRWDDSSCLLTEQTHYRWRHDDGGEGVSASEWFDTNWGLRKRIRIVNADNATYATTTVKIPVTYDADMQADFEDLRFTASNGVTPLDYWIERYTASSDATVWVEIFNLPAQDNLDIFMYYDNVTATSTSSSTATFIVAEDFESGFSGAYSGDTSLFTVDASFAYGGTKGLDTTGFESSRATDGIARFDKTVGQGQIIRYMQYVDTIAGSGDEACTMFGVQSPVTGNNNYGVCLEQFGTDRMSLVENVESTDTFGSVSVLASSTVTYATGWYEVEVDWQTNNSMKVSLFNSVGTLIASTTATDATKTSGGFGFTYWGQNGGWDSFTSRYRTNTKPTILFGAEQTNGGASWATALDSVANVFAIDDVARVRFSIENSGLNITGQQFQIEYAAKGAAPACEAVSASNYVSVPAQASCGASPICMVSSSFFANGDNTTDLLSETSGTFTSGKMVEDPSSITSALNINQNHYTELEYAVSPTANATSSSYCLRLTNAGSDFDSYLNIAEIGISFAPTISAWSLNGGADITLTPGTTTTIYATGTVTDLNGYSDLAGATSTTFRSGVTETCTSDQNNCYRTATPQCSYSGCAGNSCTLSCSANIYYFAEATDIGTYSGETWRSYVELSDQGGATTSAFAPSVDLLTINAIALDSGANTINYGSLAPQTDTGAYNATTTVENVGNGNIDVSIDGTDLTDGGASTIPVSEQKFASTTFNYAACGFCTTLATTTNAIEVDLFKPTSTSTPVLADVYWGIQIPFGTAAAPHQGTNTFYAVTD